MSVLKNLRSLSGMEFYKNALFIRKDLTQWLLRDFGAKKNPKSVRQYLKDATPEEQETINRIYEAHGKNPNKAFVSEYPDWFVDFERRVITEKLFEMMTSITEANSIYPYREFEFDLRRKYQDNAIVCCYALYQELQYIVSLFPADLNRFVYILDSIERETQLLKGWRQSDNKRRDEKEKKQGAGL